MTRLLQPNVCDRVSLARAVSRGACEESTVMKSIFLYLLGVPVVLIIALNLFGVL